MPILMQPGEFPERRRQDPKRRAEARVFDALKELELPGRCLYEFRWREHGIQVDLALWLTQLGRFAGQVKGGRYALDRNGQWYLITLDGERKPVESPLQETADASIELRNAIEEAAGYRNYVAGLLFFPDMERDEFMERVARDHDCVRIIWGLDTLAEDLQRIAECVGFFYPPKALHSENEWQKVNRLQYGGVERTAGSREQTPTPSESKAVGELPETSLSADSIVIQIQRVDRLEVRHYHRGREEERGLLPRE